MIETGLKFYTSTIRQIIFGLQSNGEEEEELIVGEEKRDNSLTLLEIFRNTIILVLFGNTFGIFVFVFEFFYFFRINKVKYSEFNILGFEIKYN